MIVEFSFLLPMVQKYKNRLRDGRVIVENQVTPFLSRHSVIRLQPEQ